MTMAKGSTKTEQVNELTKQIISESVAAEYAALGITSDPMSLYENGRNVGSFGRKKKLCLQLVLGIRD